MAAQSTPRNEGPLCGETLLALRTSPGGRGCHRGQCHTFPEASLGSPHGTWQSPPSTKLGLVTRTRKHSEPQVMPSVAGSVGSRGSGPWLRAVPALVFFSLVT